MIKSLPEAMERLASFETHLFQAQRLAIRATQQCNVLLQHLQQGIVHYDPAGRVVLLSDEACRQFGLVLPAARWYGLSALELAQLVRGQLADPDSFAVTTDQLWAQCQQPGTELKLTNGCVLTRDVQPMQTEAGTAFLVSYRDVTASRRARWAADCPNCPPTVSGALGA